MIALARVYARALLVRGSTWALVAVAALLAIAGVSLDVFALDGSDAHSMGVIVGTFELAGMLLSLRACLSGVASAESGGFRATIVQTTGHIQAAAGCALGAGVGAAAACWPAILTMYVVYNLYSLTTVAIAHVLLAGFAFAVQGAVVAAWAGLGARLAGRVGGTAVGIGAFVAARLDLPTPLRACLPAPISGDTLGLVASMVGGVLAGLGLVLLAEALPEMGEGGA